MIRVMAQVIECCTSKHKVLSSNPVLQIKKQRRNKIKVKGRRDEGKITENKVFSLQELCEERKIY
jgi:hypothetical protein